ncbi:telomere-binding protein 1-like isoform X1 [Typha latifolia]|uniref:telomere-binding protein 1-like isoform X1 n=1 Tax=Typha latifolia TaxID=4733 RepID=UPI003C3095CA
MMLRKRTDYGFYGYQAPSILHLPQSAKGKRSVRRKSEDNDMRAFDLLAAVAGKLLTEGRNSSSLVNSTEAPNLTNPKTVENFNELRSSEIEALDQVSCNANAFSSRGIHQGQFNNPSGEEMCTPKEAASVPNSLFMKSDSLDKELITSVMRNKFGYSPHTVLEKGSIGTCCSVPVESAKTKEEERKTPPQAGLKVTKTKTVKKFSYVCRLMDPIVLDTKTSASVNSDNNAGVPLYKDSAPCSSSFPKHRDRTELVVASDDDENTCFKTSNTISTKAFRPHCTGVRKVRKISTSKFQKVAPTMMRRGGPSITETKPSFCRNRMHCTCQRTHRTMFKRRKFFQSFPSPFEGGMSSETVSNLPAKRSVKVEADPFDYAVNQLSSSLTSQRPSYGLKDYQVKLRIKSFKVPELFIKIPETATIGSLKRTVMEAVTSILGRGLHVGVILQGKKVKDDNKTLQQAGISFGDKLDNLGFILEPDSTQVPPQLTVPEDSHVLDSADVTVQPLRSQPAKFSLDHGAANATQCLTLTSLANSLESNHASIHSPVDGLSLDKSSANSQALVAIPPTYVDPLAVLPLRKSSKPQIVQRRIRRPFSVPEVEALVQAVEKLGTGRWRDVKHQSFDDAKHRTYVDLKDKWKTLVHTARISPQQRRGEPVPQELLDRVLSADNFWSQQQSELQEEKPATGLACIYNPISCSATEEEIDP